MSVTPRPIGWCARVPRIGVDDALADAHDRVSDLLGASSVRPEAQKLRA